MSRIHDRSVDSSVFDSFWQLAAFSECEATPCSQQWRVASGTSKAREADFFVLN